MAHMRAMLWKSKVSARNVVTALHTFRNVHKVSSDCSLTSTYFLHITVPTGARRRVVMGENGVRICLRDSVQTSGMTKEILVSNFDTVCVSQQIPSKIIVLWIYRCFQVHRQTCMDGQHFLAYVEHLTWPTANANSSISIAILSGFHTRVGKRENMAF